jgi:AraC-like DNA-binding protein/tetratricopeptide (TPR) repeat protein
MATTLMSRDVRQALTLLKADPAGEHTIEGLAASCQVAPRTLQEHFRQCLGESPKQVLRGIRLDLVRRELLAGRGDTEITGLAIRHGFNHLGRFSGWYRDRYGESPSATLRRQQNAIGRARPPALVLPLAFDRPVVAVLPFRFAGADPRQASDLAGEVALALTRSRSVSVGPARDARYHLRGDVKTNDTGQMRATVTLLDAASERRLWADTWEGQREDTLAFEARVAQRLAAKLPTVVGGVEIERASRKEPEKSTAWELTMRAQSLATVQTPSCLAEAIDLASKAVELAPFDPLPSALLALCHANLATFRMHIEQGRGAARPWADRASQSPVRDPTAEAFLAATHTLLFDLDAAEIHINEALALDGGCALAWHVGGKIKVYRGRPKEAIEYFQISAGLDPTGSLRCHNSHGMGFANFDAGRYIEAACWWKRSMVESPAQWWPNRFLAPTYALLGRKDEARASLRSLRDAFPPWFFIHPTKALPTTDAFNDQVANGWDSIGVRSV